MKQIDLLRLKSFELALALALATSLLEDYLFASLELGGCEKNKLNRTNIHSYETVPMGNHLNI